MALTMNPMTTVKIMIKKQPILKQKRKNQPNKEKVFELGNNRGIVSNNSELGNEGTKSKSKKNIANKKIKKRRENKTNQNNQNNKNYNVSRDKGSKKEEAKRVLKKNHQQNQKITRGSKQDKIKGIREKHRKPDG